MSEPVIYVLRSGYKLVGYTRSHDIAQWWADQLHNRGWTRLQEMRFSQKEAERIVDEVIAPKTP